MSISQIVSFIINMVIKMKLDYRRIKDLREYCNMSQKVVAEQLNLTRSAYSNYENGLRTIPIEVLDAMAELYGTSIDYILGRTDEKEPYPKKR